MATRKKTSTRSAAPETAAVETPPESPAEETGFSERVQAVTPDEWQRGWKIYCYRTWPVIDRRENEHFICKLNEPIDEEYLLRFFGSGKYFLRLNDSHGKTVASKSVSVHNPQFPPKVSPDEVLAGDPRNDRYFQVWQPTDDAKNAKQPAAPSSDSSAAVQAIDRFANLTQQILDRGTGLDDDERQMFRKAHEESLKLVTAHAQPPPKETVKDLLEVLKSAKALLTPTPQPGLLDNIEKLTEAVTTIRGLFPAPTAPEVQPASAEPPNIWVQLLSTPAAAALVNKLADSLPRLLAVTAASAGAGAATPMQAPKPTPFQAGGKPAQPDATPAAVATGQPATPAAATPAQPVADEQPAPAEAGASEPLTVETALFQSLTLILRAVSMRADGEDIAAALALTNPPVYTCLKDAGTDGILAAAKADAQAWFLIEPMKEQFRDLFDDFMAWAQEEPEDGPEPTSPPEPDSPPAAPTAGKEGNGSSESDS